MTYDTRPRPENYTKESIFAKEIFHLLDRQIDRLSVCEFGAWDGLHKSNIRQFALNRCALAIFIEADKKKYRDLKKNYANEDNVLLLNQFVETAGSRSLDETFKRHNCSHIDFLSIDIDGNDYHILKSIKSTSIDIICIEFNPTIPFDDVYVQPDNFSIGHGSSLAAIKTLASRQGYTLLTVIGVNALLIRNELLTKEIENFTLLNYPVPVGPTPVSLYVGFDGQIFSNVTSIYLNWHKVSARINRITPVPKFFQVIPESMPPIKKILYYIWLAYKRPERLTASNVKNVLIKFFKIHRK